MAACVFGEVTLVKRQPDDNMRVDKNYFSSPSVPLK
jgi:hypothetical protein